MLGNRHEICHFYPESMDSSVYVYGQKHSIVLQNNYFFDCISLLRVAFSTSQAPKAPFSYFGDTSGTSEYKKLSQSHFGHLESTIGTP
jgi:hypothetical protein